MNRRTLFILVVSLWLAAILSACATPNGSVPILALSAHQSLAASLKPPSAALGGQQIVAEVRAISQPCVQSKSADMRMPETIVDLQALASYHERASPWSAQVEAETVSQTIVQSQSATIGMPETIVDLQALAAYHESASQQSAQPEYQTSFPLTCVAS